MSEPMKQENLEVTQSETRTCGFQTTAYVRKKDYTFGKYFYKVVGHKRVAFFISLLYIYFAFDYLLEVYAL